MSDSIKHYGVKGMKHGVRRYQNINGSLTALGRQRLGVGLGVSKLGPNQEYRVVQVPLNDGSGRTMMKKVIVNKQPAHAKDPEPTPTKQPTLPSPSAESDKKKSSSKKKKKKSSSSKKKSSKKKSGGGSSKKSKGKGKGKGSSKKKGSGKKGKGSNKKGKNKKGKSKKNKKNKLRLAVANTKKNKPRFEVVKTKKKVATPKKATIRNAIQNIPKRSNKKSTSTYRKPSKAPEIKDAKTYFSANMSSKSVKHDGISHSGVKGQKWGVRRYQYEDGTLTPEGRARLGRGPARAKGSTKNKAAKTSKISEFLKKRKEKKAARKELQKEQEFRNGMKTYNGRDPYDSKSISKLSTQDIVARTERLRAERLYLEEIKQSPQAKAAFAKEAKKHILIKNLKNSLQEDLPREVSRQGSRMAVEYLVNSIKNSSNSNQKKK
jgi:hypothetical protein